MRTLPSFRFAVRACSLLAVVAGLTVGLHAQTAAGTITGRVLNTANGRYLDTVRVTVGGTQLQTFTDSSGIYRLSNVPAGTAQVTYLYTGLTSQTVPVTVAAGQTVNQDVSLTPVGKSAVSSDLMKLDPFTVNEQKETNAQVIATNERQRFAPNLEKVVSSDAFGQIFQGNVAEFVKFMPGVSIDYNSMDARWIMIRGLSPQYTPVMVDGMRMSSAASTSLNRFFETEEVSINNIARIELAESRTPDLGADAMGGSVNMISKSAFEYSKPTLSYQAYMDWNGGYRELGATPGPADNQYSHKIQPGFDFTFVDPVSKTFGFTISAFDYNNYNEQYRSNPNWFPQGRNAAPGLIPQSNPFLETYIMQDAPKDNHRQSLSGTADWKISPNDTLSMATQENYYDAYFHGRNISFDTSSTTPTSYGPAFTNGALGKGTVTMGSSDRWKWGTTFNFDLRYIHHGPVWTAKAAFDYSHASGHYSDAAGGYFDTTSLSIKNASVNYAGIDTYGGVRPGTITVNNTAGTAPINFYDFGNYTINSAVSDPQNALDQFRTWKGSLKRDIGLPFPTTVKIGAQVSYQTRDIRNHSNTYNFVGPDHVAGTADDVAGLYRGQLTDFSNSRLGQPYGFAPITWLSNTNLYQMEQANMSWFSLVQTGSGGSIANDAKNSVFVQERIPAVYATVDNRLLDNRLRLVWGARAEQTNDVAFGAKNNPNAIFANGRSGALITTDPVQQTILQWQDRGTRSTDKYAGLYPSANATYNITNNFLWRVTYYRGLGRPNFGNIAGLIALPDVTIAGSTITAPNPQLKPEQSDNYETGLEYYAPGGGSASAQVFRKDFVNFFGSSRTALTADLANSLGISQDYVAAGDILATSLNAGTARVTGYELAVNQPINFVPNWANGFSVFANMTQLHLQGTPLADFTSFIPRSVNWGVKYSARRILANVNWNWRGTERLAVLNTGDPSGATYDYFKDRLYLDVDFSYQLFKHLSLFMSGKNITNVPQDDQRYGPQTPGYAKLFRREIFGSTYTVGIRGTF